MSSTVITKEPQTSSAADRISHLSGRRNECHQDVVRVSGSEREIEAENIVKRLIQAIQKPEKLAAMRASARGFALAALDVTNMLHARLRERTANA